MAGQPLLAKLPAGGQLIATGVASPFFAPVKLAFFAALFVAVPWLLYQAWAFVAPGLYQREKKLAVPLLVSAVSLFYAGCAFAYFLVLPTVFGFLTKVTPEGVAMMTDIQAYLDFVLVIFLAFGASFELPVALVILAVLGLGHAEAAEGVARVRRRWRLRHRRDHHAAGRGIAAACWRSRCASCTKSASSPPAGWRPPARNPEAVALQRPRARLGTASNGALRRSSGGQVRRHSYGITGGW